MCSNEEKIAARSADGFEVRAVRETLIRAHATLQLFRRPDRADASIAGASDATRTSGNRSRAAQKSLAVAKLRHRCVLDPAYFLGI